VGGGRVRGDSRPLPPHPPTLTLQLVRPRPGDSPAPHRLDPQAFPCPPPPLLLLLLLAGRPAPSSAAPELSAGAVRLRLAIDVHLGRWGRVACWLTLLAAEEARRRGFAAAGRAALPLSAGDPRSRSAAALPARALGSLQRCAPRIRGRGRGSGVGAAH